MTISRTAVLVLAGMLAGCADSPERRYRGTYQVTPDEASAFLTYCSAALPAEQKRTMELLKGRFAVTNCQDLFAALTQSYILDLRKLGLREITLLQYVPNMEMLWLEGNEIEDLSPLASARRIGGILASHNRVRDVSALARSSTLASLDIRNNQLTSLRSVMALPARVRIKIEGNPFGDGFCPTDSHIQQINEYCFDEGSFAKQFHESAAESPMSDAELSDVIAQVLAYPSFAMYVHPEARGRVPVKVALLGAHVDREPEAVAFGEPIEVTQDQNELQKAVLLALERRGDRCLVQLGYPPEGVRGTLYVQRVASAWRVMEARLFE